MIEMSICDAKTILKAVLKSEMSDSIIYVYAKNDSIMMNVINQQTEEIKKLNIVSYSKDTINQRLDKVNKNNKSELALKDNVIADQKKEIRKQKTIKVLALIGDVALPILTLLAVIALK